jgi:hypothetical protein
VPCGAFGALRLVDIRQHDKNERRGMANIIKIEPRWNEKWANSPEIEVTLDEDITKMDWIYEKIPRKEDKPDNQVMLISTNNDPWVKFVYVDDPKGSPTSHGALGGHYTLTDGTVFKSRTGWSSRAGAVNNLYRNRIREELAEVTIYTPGWTCGFAGFNLYHSALTNHELWPKDYYLVREVKFRDEPNWLISAKPDKVVKYS